MTMIRCDRCSKFEREEVFHLLSKKAALYLDEVGEIETFDEEDTHFCESCVKEVQERYPDIFGIDGYFGNFVLKEEI